MKDLKLTGKTAAHEVRSKLGLVNALTTFVVIVMLFVIVRFVYEPVGKYLQFLPETSIAVILVIVLVLTLFSVMFSRMFSKQVVSSIENYSRNLDNLLNITREIREEIYGDILLERVMDRSMMITDSEAGSILLLEEDELHFKIVRGSKAKELKGKKVPTNKGVGGWVMENSSPIFIHDVSKDERFSSHVDNMTGFRTKSILAVPLIAHGQTIGVIELINKMGGNYDGRDVEMVKYLADQAAISIERAKFYEDQRNYEIQITEIMLDSMDRFIPEKRGHSKRVARYCNVLARSLGLPDERARKLYFAGLLHDIGFVRIPQDKFGAREAYMHHPQIGFDMLNPISFYSEIATFVKHHHERFDGKGYPEGLAGDKTPLEARIIGVAEAFDVMVSKQSYRASRGFDGAVEELKKNAGTQFDPELVKHFLENVTEAALE